MTKKRKRKRKTKTKENDVRDAEITMKKEVRKYQKWKKTAEYTTHKGKLIAAMKDNPCVPEKNQKYKII